MMLTLTLAAGLLAAPEPQVEPQKPLPEPQKGWVVELRGYTFHEAKPGWIIELGGFTKRRKPAETPPELILEFLWPRQEAAPNVEPIETQYHDDLSAFFQQFEAQIQIEPIETIYVDDLPAFFKRLHQQKP